MEEVELAVACDFSEVGLEMGIQTIREKYPNRSAYNGILVVSIFDVQAALGFMIRQDHDFVYVNEVHVTPYFQKSEWQFGTPGVATRDMEVIYVRSKA